MYEPWLLTLHVHVLSVGLSSLMSVVRQLGLAGTFEREVECETNKGKRKFSSVLSGIVLVKN